MVSNSDYIAPIMRLDEAEALAFFLAEHDPWKPLALRLASEVGDRRKRNQESERRRALHAAHEASGTDAEDTVGHGSGTDASVIDPAVGGMV